MSLKNLNEGYVKKGGLNSKPVSSRPPAPPPQKPANVKVDNKPAE